MTEHEHSHHQRTTAGSRTSRGGLVLLPFLAMGGALLFTEHRAHVLGFLPWLFILACPLMHVFMHGGHGGHRHGRSDQTGSDARGATGRRDSSTGESS